MNDDIVTSDLSRFGPRERVVVGQMLLAWDKHGLPSDFEDDEVVPMFNRHSNKVFLSNEHYQVAVLEDEKLVSHYYLGYEGHEGTLKELELEFSYSGDNWHPDDVAEFESIRKYNEVGA